MIKCSNCGATLKNEACLFATYKINMDGKEVMVCCINCVKQENKKKKGKKQT